jgi:hypothetical protein
MPPEAVGSEALGMSAKGCVHLVTGAGSVAPTKLGVMHAHFLPTDVHGKLFRSFTDSLRRYFHTIGKLIADTFSFRHFLGYSNQGMVVARPFFCHLVIGLSTQFSIPMLSVGTSILSKPDTVGNPRFWRLMSANAALGNTWSFCSSR